MDIKIDEGPKQEILVERPSEFPLDLWNKLVEFSEPHTGARKGFEHHTWTAVYWAPKIAQAAIDEGIIGREQNPLMYLTIMAFIHDLGYSEIISEVYNEDKSRVTVSAKEEHQIKSAELAQRFFDENSEMVGRYLSPERQKELVKLIKIHDNLDYLKPDYIAHNVMLGLFSEVDSIAGIDMMFGKPSIPKEKLADWVMTRPLGYTKDEHGKWKREKGSGRYGLFLTSFGRNSYTDLSKQLIKYAKS